ncbi:MAG: mechanosensitive ion channel family protein [Myxococcota bacterium]
MSYYVTKLNVKFVSRLILSRLPSFDKKILRAAFTPVRAGYVLGLFLFGARIVGIPENWEPWVKPSATVLAAFILSWLVFSVVDLLGEWWAEYLRQAHQYSIVGIIPLVRRTLKSTVVILAALTFLQNLGIHVTALLAGLGVGGIAVALAAQKTIGDWIGGVMLILDRPIHVGDECKFGSQQGIVEEIGVRTTKIRTSERTIIAVPNADFSQMQLENLSKRDRIRINCILGLRRDTSPDQIRYLLVELRKILYAHPKIDSVPARVRLVALGASSLDIEVRAYVLTNTDNEYLAVREDLYLRFLEKIREAGTHLALPVQESVPGMMLDQEHVKSIEQRVNTWRTKKELSLPEFSPEQREALDDMLDYPPKGSVLSTESEV